MRLEGRSSPMKANSGGPDWEKFNRISTVIAELGYMADIAGELVQELDSKGDSDYFRIPRDEATSWPSPS